jgi:glycosyltransferase involved in cell wall biosynthesis
MRVLHVINALDRGGSARQVRLLAPALAHAGCAVEVCCLGSGSRHVDELRGAGIPVHVLGWTRWLDATALWELRRLVRSGDFDVIHVWRLTALRSVAVAARASLPRVVVSAPVPRQGRLTIWDRWALRRVRCLALTGETERRQCAQNGLADLRWQTVCAAVPVDGHASSTAGAVPAYPRRIACMGRLEHGRGFREAVWAVDILHQVDPDLHLLIAGAGPRRPDLQEMIDRLGIGNAHLLGSDAAADDVLAVADMCWVPSRIDCGRQAALEAMAMGRAVVASDVPCLRELIRDGDNGCLVPPGDPVALARRTLALLRDPALRARLGRAAQEEVLARCGLPRVVSRWQGLYNDQAA